MNKNHRNSQAAKTVIRCAIYTRKSTEEGLDQEFNSLDAQREAGQAYIASQQHEGWRCVSDHYDDGGYTGGNMERPALKRLLADIEAGKVDCVVVYKIDRFSRSLLDFARMMESFDKYQVSFVSVTQRFDTGSSMGRLILNVLLSFAQFERELISERTRDKISAARRKGKWSGGKPLLGYDVDAKNRKLVVNPDEAARVRAIFELYLQHEALVPTIRELSRRGWRTKSWTTRKEKLAGGQRFDKTKLYRLLRNVTYLGKVSHKGQVFAGEHPDIVPEGLYRRVQAVLDRNRRTGGALVRNRYGALLKGLLRCVPCGCSMGHTYSCKNGNKRYRYYVCLKAQKQGWDSCPSKSLPAAEIEGFVVEQIRCIGQDPSLLAATLAQARKHCSEQTLALETENRSLDKDLASHYANVRKLVARPNDADAVGQLADLQEGIRLAERRQTEIREALVALERELIDDRQVAKAFAAFDPLWQALTPSEQARVLRLLVERVDFDGANGNIAVTFHPAGIRTLADEVAAKNGGKR